MNNCNLKNHPLLSIMTAVRLIEQPPDTKLQAPDFDEHGFPVLCGTDDFYAVLTNNGQYKIVAMTFEPQQTDVGDTIGKQTFFVKLTEAFEPDEQLLLKQADAYLMCQGSEREQFPAAAVFGVVTLSTQESSRDISDYRLLAGERGAFDEFDQSRSPGENGRQTDFRSEFKQEATRTDKQDYEIEYDYDQNFGA